MENDWPRASTKFRRQINTVDDEIKKRRNVRPPPFYNELQIGDLNVHKIILQKWLEMDSAGLHASTKFHGQINYVEEELKWRNARGVDGYRPPPGSIVLIPRIEISTNKSRKNISRSRISASHHRCAKIQFHGQISSPAAVQALGSKQAERTVEDWS